MDDVLFDTEGTVPIRTDEECLEKTGSLCVGQVGVKRGRLWRPEGQELSSIRSWSKVSIHLGDLLLMQIFVPLWKSSCLGQENKLEIPQGYILETRTE